VSPTSNANFNPCQTGNQVEVAPLRGGMVIGSSGKDIGLEQGTVQISSAAYADERTHRNRGATKTMVDIHH